MENSTATNGALPHDGKTASAVHAYGYFVQISRYFDLPTHRIVRAWNGSWRRLKPMCHVRGTRILVRPDRVQEYELLVISILFAEHKLAM